MRSYINGNNIIFIESSFKEEQGTVTFFEEFIDASLEPESRETLLDMGKEFKYHGYSCNIGKTYQPPLLDHRIPRESICDSHWDESGHGVWHTMGVEEFYRQIKTQIIEKYKESLGDKEDPYDLDPYTSHDRLALQEAVRDFGDYITFNFKLVE